MLIYIHCIEGNKLEGYFLIEKFLPYFSVLLFEFNGFGNSVGNFVTYGKKELEDFKKIVRVLIKEFDFKRIYLYGRCLGGFVILKYLEYLSLFYKENVEGDENVACSLIDVPGKNFDSFRELKSKSFFLGFEEIKDFAIFQRIKGVVIDSPFFDSKDFIFNYFKKRNKVKKKWLKFWFKKIKKKIFKKTGVNIFDQYIDKENLSFFDIPILLMIGENEELIKREDFINFFENFSSKEKQLRILVESDHFDERKPEDIHFAYNFIKKIENSNKKRDMCSIIKLATFFNQNITSMKTNLQEFKFLI